MDSLKTTRLPPLDIRFEVGSIAEPPERSWARIRTCLIDNPRDDGLSRRQEVWSYHRKNRGVLKSIVRSLPSVPFRVRKGKQSHRKLRESSENGHTLPKIPHLDVKYGIRNSRFRPLGAIQKHLDLPKDDKEKISETPDSDEESQKDVNEDISCSSTLPVLPEIDQLSKRKRKVVSMNDISDDQSASRLSPVSRENSAMTDTVVGSYGPSSQTKAPSIPKSLLDIIHGSHLSESIRDLPVASLPKKQTVTINAGKTSSTHVFPGPELEKLWLENVVGEKEIIDVSTYDNFARAPRNKPESESRPSQLYASFTERRVRINVNPPIQREPQEVGSTERRVRINANPQIQREPHEVGTTERRVRINANPPIQREPNDVVQEKKYPSRGIPEATIEKRVSQRAALETVSERKNPIRNVQDFSSDKKVSKPQNDSTSNKRTLTLSERIQTVGQKPPMKHTTEGKTEIGNFYNQTLPKANSQKSPLPFTYTHDTKSSVIVSPTNSLGSDTEIMRVMSKTPSVSSSPWSFGEPIAPSPVINAPPGQRYFPVFSRDGPMRKIGGPSKNKRTLKISFPSSTNDPTPSE